MKRYYLLFICTVLSLTATADSDVYFYMRSTSGITCDVTVTKDGRLPITLTGPEKKRMKNMLNPQYPLITYSPTERKCTYTGEGTATFDLLFTWTAPDGSNKDITSSIELELTPGSVHYVRISAKGLNGMKMKEITAKEAQKLSKDSDRVRLPHLVDGVEPAKTDDIDGAAMATD